MQDSIEEVTLGSREGFPFTLVWKKTPSCPQGELDRNRILVDTIAKKELTLDDAISQALFRVVPFVRTEKGDLRVETWDEVLDIVTRQAVNSSGETLPDTGDQTEMEKNATAVPRTRSSAPPAPGQPLPPGYSPNGRRSSSDSLHLVTTGRNSPPPVPSHVRARLQSAQPPARPASGTMARPGLDSLSEEDPTRPRPSSSRPSPTVGQKPRRPRDLDGEETVPFRASDPEGLETTTPWNSSRPKTGLGALALESARGPRPPSSPPPRPAAPVAATMPDSPPVSQPVPQRRSSSPPAAVLPNAMPAQQPPPALARVIIASPLPPAPPARMEPPPAPAAALPPITPPPPRAYDTAQLPDVPPLEEKVSKKYGPEKYEPWRIWLIDRVSSKTKRTDQEIAFQWKLLVLSLALNAVTLGGITYLLFFK